MNDPPESTKVIARDTEKSGTLRATLRGHSGGSGLSTVSQLLVSPKRRKKRKLIVSGVPFNDQRRFDGVRRWCESFGEINTITRIGNGDLHVDFRSPEVADTVCRLNAKVHIGGVGSVGLSWFTGKKP